MTSRPAMQLEQYPYLQGNYAPVLDEHSFNSEELRVEGEIPADLVGAFMRNGPNIAWQPNHYVYPIDGDGMIHAVYLRDGKAHYRNRWVRTACFQVEEQLGRSCYGSLGKLTPVDEETLAAGGPPSPLKNSANTNVIYHAGKLLALWEAGFPHELNADLSTVGEFDYNGALQPGDGLTAHPKICGRNGDLITNTQLWQPPYFTVQIFDKHGVHKRAIPIDMPQRAIIHDMQICGDYVVVFCAPAYSDLEAGMKGGDPFKWLGDEPMRIAVVPRAGGEVRWFEAPTFFSWHFCNGFQRGDTLVVDYIWMESLPMSQAVDSGLEAQMRNMHRICLNLKTGAISNEKLGPTYCEFARADDRRCGLPYQYGYAAASTQSWADGPNHGYNATIGYDMESGASQLCDYGEGANSGEPVYVAKPGSENERDGYLMCYVYSPSADTYLAILQAGNLAAGPVAKIHIPTRVPNGFHANWMNGLTL